MGENERSTDARVDGQPTSGAGKATGHPMDAVRQRIFKDPSVTLASERQWIRRGLEKRRAITGGKPAPAPKQANGEAKALAESPEGRVPERALQVRVAGLAGKRYLDLGDAAWRGAPWRSTRPAGASSRRRPCGFAGRRRSAPCRSPLRGSPGAGRRLGVRRAARPRSLSDPGADRRAGLGQVDQHGHAAGPDRFDANRHGTVVDEGREAIVRSFTELTTEQMHKHWNRIDAPT